MNYYEALGVSRNSEPEVIDAAYRALMKKYHPDRWQGDKAQSEPRAKLINEAYSTLRDQQRRCAYDKTLPFEPSRRPRIRPVLSSNASAQRAVRCRPAGRSPRAQARATSRYRFSDRRLAAVTVSALLGLTAVVVLASRDSIATQLVGVPALVQPPINGSILADGRKQSFCITNMTFGRIDYKLYWGGTTGRHYELDSGHHMIHSSAYSAAPLVEFFDMDAGEPVRKALSAAVTSGRPEACRANYSFVAESPYRTGWSGDEGFGLYRENRAEFGRLNPSP